MKRTLLSLIFCTLLAIIHSYALNPFAYALSSSLSTDESTLTINYSLNATATSVKVQLLDGSTIIKTVDCSSKGLTQGTYSADIYTADLPKSTPLTWKVVVTGSSVSTPTEHPTNYDFYHPSAVDIDNNPENPTFGLILCNEAMQLVKGTKQSDTGEDYLSTSLGAGIYAFNPAFENTGKYNGGITFTNTRADGSGTAYSPRRIRISDDGRIFVTSLNTDGNYLWEVNPENMNEWTPIFKGTLNTNKELVDASSNFVAAPNVGFDVRGEGANLKLLMLSSNLRGFPETFAVNAYKCHEYNLGTATTWNTEPSTTILSGKYMINYTGDQVAYDAEGGVWFCQYQSAAKDAYPSLVHFDKNGVEDYKEVVNYRMAGGIRFNADFTKVIVAGVDEGTANSKKATIYAVSKDADGKPVLTKELVIDMTTVGNNLNDFAWDYAGNLFACGNNKEKLVAWAMPYSGTVTTPAAAKYTVTLKPDLNVYASSLVLNSFDANNRTVTISYFLNAHAATLEFQLVNESKAIIKTVTITDPTHLTKGQHNNIIIDLADVLGGKYTWKLKATAASQNETLTHINATATYRDKYYAPRGLAVDNSTESPYHGRIYITETIDGKTTGEPFRKTHEGVYILNADLTDTQSGNGTADDPAYNGGVSWISSSAGDNDTYGPFRITVDSDGYVYICDNGPISNNTTGVWRMDPANPEDNFVPILDLSKRGTNYLRINSLVVTGNDNNKKLYVLDNNADASNHKSSIKQFSMSSIPNSSAGEEIISLKNILINQRNTIVSDNQGGFWIFQHRAQIDECPTILHYRYSNEQYIQDVNTASNGTHSAMVPSSFPNHGGNGTISPDGSLLAYYGNGRVIIFAITYDKTTGAPIIDVNNPLYTHIITTKAATNTYHVNAMSFDVANNLYMISNYTELLYVYALRKTATTENSYTTPAPSSQIIEIAEPNPTNVVPRITAHNLNVEIEGIYYKFSFDANSVATAGKILFYDENDNQVGEIQILQTIKKGHNEVLIPLNQVPSENDLCWGIELTGKDMEQYICRYNHTYFPQFKFYRPQDLVIDNNPQSDYFGRIYITYPADGSGTARNFNKQLGIQVLNHNFDSIAGGLKPTGMTIGNDERRIMHRIKIGPNGNIYVLDSDSNNIYEMLPSASAPILHDNGTAKNIVADIDAITNANEFCFQEDGTMYILDDPYYLTSTDGGTGTLYKVVDGVATQHVTFANEASNLFASVDNSMEMDGRGGIWLSQGRDHWDKFPPLMHINSTGEIDFIATISSSDALKDLFPKTDNHLGTRGSMAYNRDEDILAYGGGGYVTLFKVSYTGANGAPVLTKWLETPHIGDNIDGIDFDYAGNLFVTSSTAQRFHAYAIPQATNKITVRAQNTKTVHKIIPLEDTKDNTTLLTEYTNKEEEVFVFRSLTAGMYNTLCLPFSLASFTGTPLENTTVWQYNGAIVENEATNKEIFLNFEEVTAIEAGKPYLVEPTTDIASPMEFKNVTISVTNGSEVTQSVVTMQGILHPTQLQANDKSILFLVANNSLAWANVTADINGMRAYFQVNDPSLLSARTRAYIRKAPAVTTDNENIASDENTAKKVIYDNQLYIIRNNDVYTIQGTKVK